MVSSKLTALELVLTFLTIFGPVTEESLATVCVLFEAVLGYTGEFDKDTVRKARGVANQLCELAEVYGVICEPEQLETITGRRAILLLILEPILEHLAPNDLEEMRNDAVEAMMVVTFKSLDEVQDLVEAWAKEAIKTGVYQTRVSAWTGQPMEKYLVDVNEACENVTTPNSGEMSITTDSNALEIVLTLLVMLGPVTKDSVEATKVLFGAVLGFDEAKAKFDKETVRKVPTVAEPLCFLGNQYGVVAESRMLNALPGTRAILRVIVGPIIEGYSPDELEEIRNDAEEAMTMVFYKPLDEVKELVAAWTNVAKPDSRYQARAAAWTGKPMEFFDKAGAIECSTTNKAIREYESRLSNDISPTDLELGSATNIVGLVTIQALSAIGLISAPEFAFRTVFPTPMDVCFGRKGFNPWNDSVGAIEETKSPAKYGSDSDDSGATSCLMDASDEEDYHRLAGFRFPRSARISPALCSLARTRPETSPLQIGESVNTFVDWMATWEAQEMTAWKAALRKTAKAEVETEKRKAVFGGYEDVWETAQLSAWSDALRSHNSGDVYLSGSRASCLPLDCKGKKDREETRVSMVAKDDPIKFICWLFGLA